MTLEIQNFKQINKGALKASFEVHIPEWDLTIKNMCYFGKDDGSVWVTYPSREVTNHEGKKKYYPQIVFGSRVGPRLEKAIKEKIDIIANVAKTTEYVEIPDDANFKQDTLF